MQYLFAYLLKLLFCLALGYSFYLLLLRRMTWYNWNRYYLLLFPLFALAIPLLPVHLPAEVQNFNAAFFITDAAPQVSANNMQDGVLQTGMQWNMVTILLLVAIAGALFFLFRFFLRFYSLRKARSAAEMVSGGEVKLYHLPGCTAPFSFYNSIYLDMETYQQPELEKIIAHEMVHVSGKHTVDMLLAEFLCIIQWFNPFAWLLKHAIKQNLEFIADDTVLGKGISRKSYQYLLLKVSGAMPYTLANNLLFPSLKKRIQMMNRAKTTKIHLLKFMCIVPLGCLLLVAFSGPGSRPVAAKLHQSSEAFSLSSLSFYINDETVAALVKKEQQKSFLIPGGPLSLALISDEKTRLKNLLEKNGYENLNNAITFVMDTSAATRSFSVQITIQLEKHKKTIQSINKKTKSSYAANAVVPINSQHNAPALPGSKTDHSGNDPEPVNRVAVTGSPAAMQ
jgi:beta-lactamase regulating signal transducer with metallopeptidase domain